MPQFINPVSSRDLRLTMELCANHHTKSASVNSPPEWEVQFIQHVFVWDNG